VNFQRRHGGGEESLLGGYVSCKLRAEWRNQGPRDID